MAVNLFDPNFYRAANPDLAGLNDAQALSHFQSNGLDENRPFSPFANLNFYRSSNPDLEGAGVSTNRQLFDHLQNSGVAEGRSFSEFVDIDYYLLANSDVSQAVGENYELALEHLRTSGINEVRSFSFYVDLGYYLSNNPDVNQVTGGSRARALEHLEIFGLSEGRQFSPAFDVSFYRNTYPDLTNAGLTNNRSLFQHWVTTGDAVDGRSGTPDPGNSLVTALNLGFPAATSATFFNDFVGSSDTNDYYRLTLNESRAISANILAPSADLNLVLLDNNGTVIPNSSVPDSAGDSVSSLLNPGTYFIQVTQGVPNASSNYNLLFVSFIPA